MLAEMLTEFRFAMTAWRDISMSRLRDLGIVSFTEQEHDRLLQLIADKAVDKVVEEAKHKVDERRDQWWQQRSLRVGVVVAILGLILSSVTTSVAVVAFIWHH